MKNFKKFAFILVPILLVFIIFGVLKVDPLSYVQKAICWVQLQADVPSAKHLHLFGNC